MDVDDLTTPQGWPEPDAQASEPTRAHGQMEQLDARIALEERRRSSQLDELAARNATSDYTERKLHDALGSLAMSAVDRARRGAEFVQTAASAIGALYAAGLSIVLVAGEPLPLRALVPAVFLGMAIVLASYYLAFFGRGKPIGRPEYTLVPAEDAWVRTEYLAHFAEAVATNRVRALRGGVVSLALAVLSLPIGLVGDTTQIDVSSLAWPPPPSIQPTEMAQILYEHQLTVFQASIGHQGVASSPATDIIAVVILVLGFVAIAGTMRLPVLSQARPASDDGQGAPSAN